MLCPARVNAGLFLADSSAASDDGYFALSHYYGAHISGMSRASAPARPGPPRPPPRELDEGHNYIHTASRGGISNVHVLRAPRPHLFLKKRAAMFLRGSGRPSRSDSCVLRARRKPMETWRSITFF